MSKKYFRIVTLTYLLVFAFACKDKEETPIPELLTLRTQADVNSFKYTSLQGNLRINGELINDLTPLSKLTHIGGFLSIDDNALLPNLKGLENIASIDSGLSIQYNFALTSLEGLSGLTKVGKYIMISGNRQIVSMRGLTNLKAFDGYMSIFSNEKLTSLDGFDYSEISGLEISENSALKDLKGVESIKELVNLSVWSNIMLASLNGLQNLQRIENQIYISRNVSLKNLSGLDGLNYVGDALRIGNNDSLQSLEGLNNLEYVKYTLEIGSYNYGDALSNPMLTNFCAISSLVLNKDSSRVFIRNNGYNPTHQQFVDGLCSK